MDEQDVIVIDNRNAVVRMPSFIPRANLPQSRPPVVVHAPPTVYTQAQPAVYAQAQPTVYAQGAPAGAVTYVRDPATGALVREQAGAASTGAPMTSKLGALGTGTLIAMGAQLLAAMLPLPAQPAPTGDIATDVRNAQLYNAAQAATWQRYERINTFASLIQRVV